MFLASFFNYGSLPSIFAVRRGCAALPSRQRAGALRSRCGVRVFALAEAGARLISYWGKVYIGETL